eukprot:6615880-Pyramimonas_sp.AAC.1
MLEVRDHCVLRTAIPPLLGSSPDPLRRPCPVHHVTQHVPDLQRSNLRARCREARACGRHLDETQRPGVLQ